MEEDDDDLLSFIWTWLLLPLSVVIWTGRHQVDLTSARSCNYSCTNSWWWLSTPEICRVVYRSVINWIQSHPVGQFFILRLTHHLLGITKLDQEKNQCVRQKTGAQNIVKEIKQYQKKWLKHVQRTDTNRLPKRALQYKPKGWRDVGRPRKRWRDKLHLEDQGKGNTPNPSGAWWWWWWRLTHFPVYPILRCLGTGALCRLEHTTEVWPITAKHRYY